MLTSFDNFNFKSVTNSSGVTQQKPEVIANYNQNMRGRSYIRGGLILELIRYIF